MRLTIPIDKKDTTINTGMGLLLTFNEPSSLTVKYGMVAKTYTGIPFNSVVSITLYKDEGRFSLRRMYPPHNPQKILNAYYRRNVSIVLSDKQSQSIVFDKLTNTATISSKQTVAKLHEVLSVKTGKRLQIVNMLCEDVSSLTVKEWFDRFPNTLNYKEV